MFPSLGPDIEHIDNIYFNSEDLGAVFRCQFPVLMWISSRVRELVAKNNEILVEFKPPNQLV